MLVLTVDSYGAEQLVIFNSESVSGSSVTVVDSRTVRVHVAIEEDFLQKFPPPQSINLSGFATVTSGSSGGNIPSLSAQFMLDLKYVEDIVSLLCYYFNVGNISPIFLSCHFILANIFPDYFKITYI